jgi:hypothetical protein
MEAGPENNRLGGAEETGLQMVIDQDLAALREKVVEWNRGYDPERRMLRKPFKSKGYHTTLENIDFVHPVRDSLVYALALLDSELPGNDRVGLDIVACVLELQDRRPRSATFGIWPYYDEEPLERMSPPDWNWADFCGKLLLLIDDRHRGKMDGELAEDIRLAVFAASDAIIKRNVGPHYTNIAIMGAFVVLIAGERYGHGPYLHYGLQRLEILRDHTNRLGTFEEFNSPAYTPLAIRELSAILSLTRQTRAKELVRELLEVAWRMVAEHFHPPTKQWAGPYGRTYSTVSSASIHSFLDRALSGKGALAGGRNKALSPSDYRIALHCPEPYHRFFQESGDRDLRQLVSQNAERGTQVWATTAIKGPTCLGTFNRECMWNQRRNWLAFTQNRDSFTYISLHFLHDGYDYSSAIATIAQDGLNSLLALTFCTDGGDTHIKLYPIDGTISAQDLRLRFEIGGRLEGVNATVAPEAGAGAGAAAVTEEVGGCAVVTVNEVELRIRKLFAAFEGYSSYWEIVRSEATICLDYVMYSGERKVVDFREMQRAAIVLATQFGRFGDGIRDARCSVSGDLVQAEYDSGSSAMSISVPLKPDRKSAMLLRCQSAVAKKREKEKVDRP